MKISGIIPQPFRGRYAKNETCENNIINKNNLFKTGPPFFMIFMFLV